MARWPFACALIMLMILCLQKFLTVFPINYQASTWFYEGSNRILRATP